ncbi:MAG TPA: hypothetical protein VM866_11395 [Pyrinomonadaceae bacterium]|jgi:hypothetical protein|nr:hypothetical protein [Pyrinomonadaceae bacterium]
MPTYFNTAHGKNNLCLRLIIGGEKREWLTTETDLAPFAGQAVTLRLYQNLRTTNPPAHQAPRIGRASL